MSIMPNLMITHGGALGDNGFTIPALAKLRSRYDEIYLYCRKKANMALKDTGLIDRFIVHHPDMGKATEEERRNWFFYVTEVTRIGKNFGFAIEHKDNDY